MWFFHAIFALSLSAHALSCGERFAALFSRLSEKGVIAGTDVDEFLAGDEKNPVRAGLTRLTPTESLPFERAFDAVTANLGKPEIDALVRAIAGERRGKETRTGEIRDLTAWVVGPVVKEPNLTGGNFVQLRSAHSRRSVLMTESNGDSVHPPTWTLLAPGGKPIQLPEGVTPGDATEVGGRLLVATVRTRLDRPTKLSVLDARTGAVVFERALGKTQASTAHGAEPSAVFFRNQLGELNVFIEPGRIVNLVTKVATPLPDLPRRPWMRYAPTPDGKGVVGFGVEVSQPHYDYTAIIVDGLTGKKIFETPAGHHQPQSGFADLHINGAGEMFFSLALPSGTVVHDVARGEKKRIPGWKAANPFREDRAGNVVFTYVRGNKIVSLDLRGGGKSETTFRLAKVEKRIDAVVVAGEHFFIPLEDKVLAVTRDGASEERIAISDGKIPQLVVTADDQVAALTQSPGARLRLTQLYGPPVPR